MQHIRFTYMVALPLMLVMLCSFASMARADEPPPFPSVLPRYGMESKLSLEDRDALQNIVAWSPEQIQEALESTDGIQVSLAIYALDQQENVQRLLELSALLDDARSALPFTAPVSSGPVVYQDQSLAEYMTYVYGQWCGVHIEGKERFDSIFSGQIVADSLAKPWIERVRRKAHAGGVDAAMLDRIETLPEPLRVVVVALSASDGYLTEQAALGVISAVSPSVVAAVGDGTAGIESDALLSTQPSANKQIRSALERLGVLDSP